MNANTLSPEETKALFERIKASTDLYPANLDEIYQFAYSNKHHALRAIRREGNIGEYSERKQNGRIVCFTNVGLFRKLFLKDSELSRLFDSITPQETSITPVEPEEIEELPDVLPFFDSKHISSLDIAKAVGKEHKNVMRDMREMEDAWVHQGQLKFELSSYLDRNNRSHPCYLLDMLQSLFVASKYKHDVRAKIILAWDELKKRQQQPLTQAQFLLQSAQLMVQLEERTQAIEQKLNTIEQNQKQAELELFEIPTTDEPMAEITTRTRVVALVAKYAEAVFPLDADKYRKAWRFFYDELLKRYHFRAYEDKSRGYTKLDDVEQRGALQYLYIIVSNYVNELNETK